MSFPSDIGIIDLMVGFPSTDLKKLYQFLRGGTRDAQSREEFVFPVEYMFKDVPGEIERGVDPVAVTLGEMDKYGVERGMVDCSGVGERALREHADRFVPSTNVDPNGGMKAVESIARAYETFGVKAVTTFPAGCIPQVPIDDKRYYPVYAKCAELGLPIFICAGVPGPRVPMACQEVARLDEVCWWFPELTIVTRHGCEPWADLAVKLMLKWPNLYYSTSAFAPKYYPADIVNYANTRGADKILYAGYFPMGLTYERIMRDLPQVPFRDKVWPKFLRENAIRVLGLDA